MHDPQEKELVRVLLKYGQQEASFTGESEPTEEPVKFTMKIADYIIESMKEDSFTFSNELLAKVYAEYCRLYEAGEPVTEEYFVRHPDTDISQIGATMASELYPLANWGRRSIGIKTEEDHLGITAEKAVFAFKMPKN